MSTEHAHPHHGHHHHHADAAPQAVNDATTEAAAQPQPVLAEVPVEGSVTGQTDVTGTSDIANDPANPAPGGLLIEADAERAAAAAAEAANAEAERAAGAVPEAPAAPSWPDDVNDADAKIEHLFQRLTNLESMVGAVANNGTKMAMQFGQVQGAIQQIGQLITQLASKVNSMDPKRPILEVTLCKYRPIVDTEKKEFAFKATVHGETHPERPNTLDALRLDESDPTAPHWVPVGVMPELTAFIMQLLKDAGIAQETWAWIKLVEKPRPTGVTDSFSIGEDTSEPQEQSSSLSVEAADAVSTFANGESPDPGVSEAVGVTPANDADTNEA